MGCEQSSQAATSSSKRSRSNSLNPLVPPAQRGGGEEHEFSVRGGVLSHRLICHPQLTQEIMTYLPAGIGYARLMKKNRGDAYSVATAEEILARQHAALENGESEETLGRRNSIMNLRPASAPKAVASSATTTANVSTTRPGIEKAPQGGSATSNYDGGWLTLRLVNSRCKVAVDYFVVDRVCEGIISRFIALDQHGYRPCRAPCSGGEIALASLLPYAIGEQDDEDRRAQEVLRQRRLQAARDANKAPPRSKLLAHHAVSGGDGNAESSGENVEETERARQVQMANLSRFNQFFEEEAEADNLPYVWSNRIQERLNQLVFGGGIEEENVMKAQAQQFVGGNNNINTTAVLSEKPAGGGGEDNSSSGVRLNTISEVQADGEEDDDDENFLDRVASGAADGGLPNNANATALTQGSNINQIKYRILVLDDVVLPHPVMIGGNIVTSLQVGQYAHEQFKKRSRRSVDRQAHEERMQIASASLRRNPVNNNTNTNSKKALSAKVDPSKMDPWTPGVEEEGANFVMSDAVGDDDGTRATDNGGGRIDHLSSKKAGELGTLHANSMQKMLIIPLPYAIAEDFARERLRKRPVSKKIITSDLTPPENIAAADDGAPSDNPLMKVPSATHGYYSPASIKTQNSGDFKAVGPPGSLNNSTQSGGAGGALTKSNSSSIPAKGVKERKKTSSLGRVAGGRKKVDQQQAAAKAAAKKEETATEKANRLRQEEAWRREDIEIQRTLGLAADRQTQIENMIQAPALEIRSSAPIGKITAGVLREAPIRSAQFSVQGFTTVHTLGEDFARECPHLETVDISPFYALREIEDNFCYASKKLTEVILGSKEESSQGFAHVMTFDAETAPKGFVNLEYIGRNFLYRCSSFVSDGLDSGHPARKGEADAGGSSSTSPPQATNNSQLRGIDSSTSLNLVSAFALGAEFFPKLKQIDHGFMLGCASITRIELANLASLELLGDDCLMGCRVLSGVTVGPCPQLKKIGNRFCSKNKSLTSVLLKELPFLKQFGGGFLQECSELRSLDLRQCQSLATIGPDFCHSCSTLKMLNLKGLDSLMSIGQGMLVGCPLVKDIEVDTNNVNELLAEALWDR